ncbi:hypothetical protein [Burkholderia cepacia]|uniref:hypothetical protein n=1 Tax=Burkholderia cepacia TaxID=292 RepID=UPI0034511A23
MGKLYKPPVDSARQVFALSRHDAEKLPRLPSIAIISVTTPERPPASLDGFAHLLRLSFADVDFPSPNLSTKSRGRLGTTVASGDVARWPAIEANRRRGRGRFLPAG